MAIHTVFACTLTVAQGLRAKELKLATKTLALGSDPEAAAEVVRLLARKGVMIKHAKAGVDLGLDTTAAPAEASRSTDHARRRQGTNRSRS